MESIFAVVKTGIIMGGYSDPTTETVNATIEYLNLELEHCDYGKPVPEINGSFLVSGAAMIWSDPYLLVQGGKMPGVNTVVGM